MTCRKASLRRCRFPGRCRRLRPASANCGYATATEFIAPSISRSRRGAFAARLREKKHRLHENRIWSWERSGCGRCSMKKSKLVVTATAEELAKALGLTPADGAEMQLRSDLNSKIAKIVRRKRLTHAQVACLAGTSRSRVTAILNRNTQDISTDLLLRILYALGYTAEFTFQKAAGNARRAEPRRLTPLHLALTVESDLARVRHELALSFTSQIRVIRLWTRGHSGARTGCGLKLRDGCKTKRCAGGWDRDRRGPRRRGC